MTVDHHPVVENARHRAGPFQVPPFRRQAFSLIEICIALGIVAFAFVAMLGLLPVGLANFSKAMDTQTSTEIYQRLSAELQETEFDNLIKLGRNRPSGTVPFFFLKTRYFDAEGQEIKVTNSEAISDVESKRVLYTVTTRGSFPGDASPANHNSNYFTSLPDISGKRWNPRDVMFFSFQVIQSKGRDITTILDPTHFVDPAKAAQQGFPYRTYSIHVARNGYDLTQPYNP